jgi:hypothetical protein
MGKLHDTFPAAAVETFARRLKLISDLVAESTEDDEDTARLWRMAHRQGTSLALTLETAATRAGVLCRVVQPET